MIDIVDFYNIIVIVPKSMVGTADHSHPMDFLMNGQMWPGLSGVPTPIHRLQFVVSEWNKRRDEKKENILEVFYEPMEESLNFDIKMKATSIIAVKETDFLELTLDCT